MCLTHERRIYPRDRRISIDKINRPIYIKYKNYVVHVLVKGICLTVMLSLTSKL